jgi:hypothetical protein
VFDGSDLSFLYSEQTAEGQTSRFFKFVRRTTADRAEG